MVPPRAFGPNLALAAVLVAIITSWFVLASGDLTSQLAYGALAATTGTLAIVALIRPPAQNRDERWWVLAICLVSMLYAFGYEFDPYSPRLRLIFWGRIGLQFLAGIVLLSLGTSYALLPALRHVRKGFVYRYVRHPVYAMYILADVIVILLQPSLWNLGVALLGAGAFCLRARLEEKVLRHDPVYSSYMLAVPWRFFPGIH